MGLALEMLSALIPTGYSYPAMLAQGLTTGTPGIRPSWSSRTEESSPQESKRSHWIETDNLLQSSCWLQFLLEQLRNLDTLYGYSLHVAMQFGLYLPPLFP